MKRKDLNEAVRRSAEDLGYVFYSGDDSFLAAKATALPAAWLSPMTLKATRGRKERRDIYGIRIRFLSAVPAGVGSGAERVREILEADASAFADALRSCAGVRSIGSLRVAPQKTPLTVAGEISVMAEFDVETSYNRY